VSESFNPPSRQRARALRRSTRSERRRKLVGVPAMIVGVALVGAGGYTFLQNDDPSDIVPVEVGGTSIVRGTTTSSTTSSTTTTTEPLGLGFSEGTTDDPIGGTEVPGSP